MLKQKVTNNVMATKGEKVIKQGIPVDHARKHTVNNPGRVVGVNVGITRNMGDYESLRVDTWLSDILNQGESFSEGFERIKKIAIEEIAKFVEELEVFG